MIKIPKINKYTYIKYFAPSHLFLITPLCLSRMSLSTDIFTVETQSPKF